MIKSQLGTLYFVFNILFDINMRHINYNHLFYFWNVAESGSIRKASQKLYLTPQTISAQIKLLEESTGTILFKKSGRSLVLTDSGDVVKKFADEIFSLGTELSVYMRGEEKEVSGNLRVGIVETLPKIAVEQFLEPAFDANARLFCKEGKLESLVEELKNRELDLVLSDQSYMLENSTHIYNHILGISKLALFAPETLYKRYASKPISTLNQAPFLLPTDSSPLRQAGDNWFLEHGITPNIVAECSDSALIKSMAMAGRGLFIGPLNIREHIEYSTRCKVITELDGFAERYYSITLDSKIEHPVVSEIVDRAKTSLALDN